MKTKTVILIAAAVILLCGSSPWEGAAAVAPNGELPATGRYVSTNSFPVNTVVDITNIETGRSTRAIVANKLDSPGLLALVSREAAQLIGMRAGSVGRIRMTQPSDPIAYLRFKEGVAAGIADYDSGNVITEETFREETSRENANQTVPEQPQPPVQPPVQPPSQQQTVQQPPPPSQSVNNEPSPAANQTASGYLLEPEWGGRSSNIVNLPQYLPEEVAEEKPVEEAHPQEVAEETPVEEAHPQEIAEETPVEEAQPEEIAEETPVEEAQPEEIAEETPVEEAQPQEIAEETPVEEAQPQEVAEETPVEEAQPQEIAVETPVEEEQPQEIAEETPVEEEQPQEIAEAAEYNIVPAPERPPVSDLYGIDPASIIPGIADAPAKPEEEIAELKEEERQEELIFSIPRVTELRSGKYYVQIAALDSVESVENAVRQIDTSYLPVIYKDGDRWYRILLGPLNQGESAAVLQRFKSIGFKDAFVRQVR